MSFFKTIAYGVLVLVVISLIISSGGTFIWKSAKSLLGFAR